jgi:glutamate-5-semialdehyde dehydrogenase
VHESRLSDLPAIVEPLWEKNVIIYADDKAFAAVANSALYTLHSTLLQHATSESFGTEFMDYKMAIRTVASLEEALAHIDQYGSGHSESIVTENETTARQFQQMVDAACVYWNAPTSFTDGAQFGLGAEIGISTQKLGPRGPMALEEICTYKWLIEGEGQTRP